MPVEIRRDAKGRVDEVVATNATVHLERMDKDAWFLAVKGDDGVEEVFWLNRDGKKVEVSLHETR